jgi:DNA-binding transcriptional MerR regulator
MNTHRYTFDLQQVSELLNKRITLDEKVSPSQLKEWAEQGCFPSERRNGTLRVDQEVITLIEKTRKFILSQGYTIDQVKRALSNEIKAKEKALQRKEKMEAFHLEDPYAEEGLIENINEQLNNLTEGVLKMLNVSEESIKSGNEENLIKTEERIKRTVIHSEIRMKDVVDRTEKRILQQMQQFLNDAAKKEAEEEKQNLTKIISEMELVIKRHENEMLGLQESHQAELISLTNDYEEQINELKEKNEMKYQELIEASFFERIKMKKEWKLKNKNN